MLLLCFALSWHGQLLATPSRGDLAHRVQIHLSAVGQPWLLRKGRKLKKAIPKGQRSMVFEVELNRRGGFTRVRRSLSSGTRRIDKLGRGLFRLVPPLPKRPALLKKTKRNIPCVVQLTLQGVPKDLDVAVVCLPASKNPPLAAKQRAKDASAGASLFNGWQLEKQGEPLKALSAFRKAVKQAPRWKLASLAMGLNLARAGRLEDARPHLKRYARKERPSREIRRYIAGKGLGLGDGGEELSDTPDEDSIAACERDEREISRFVQKRFRKVRRCVDAERKRSPSAMPPHIPVNFVIAPQGTVRDVVVDHRFYRDGSPLNACVTKALRAKLEARGGTACPAQFELEVETIEYRTF